MRGVTLIRSAIATCVVMTGTLGTPGASAQSGPYEDCIIEPAMVLEIGSPIEGVIERIEAQRGAVVRRGEPIAWLESSIERESLRMAEARANSKVGIEIAEAQLDLERKEVARAREMARRNIGTSSALDIAEAELLTAELQLQRAREANLLDRMELARAQAVLDRRVIRSPIDGIILRRLIGPGETVYTQAQIAQLADIDPLYVDVFLPTSIYNSVAPGQTATVYPAAPIGGEYTAVIRSIDQVFDAASDTFAVRLELPNPDMRLPAGVDCSVSLDIG